jgi:hypothetical protein
MLSLHAAALQSIIQRSADVDAREIGKDLFKLLAQNESCKETMTAAMRAFMEQVTTSQQPQPVKKP